MTTRRLAAILAADVVGSSRLIEADEGYALTTIREVLHDVLVGTAASHGGRLMKTMGDGALLEFASPVDAVTCATVVQSALAERAASEPEDRRVLLRIGVNLGDVVAQTDGDLYGDGVNIAVRLESIAFPGGIAISGKVHDELQGKVTLVFQDQGEQSLKNVARPVRVYALGASALGAAAIGKPLPLPDKPSIAVLPFTNMSGPDDEYFCDGMVEDIITALSKVRSFFVIARNSSFTYKGRAVDVKQVGRELGVRYVLEGSVRRAGNRLRITGQLIDAATGHHVWADRFDGNTEDIFALQDEITQQVVSAIEPSLRAIEIEHAKRKPTEDLAAYDLYLRALPEFHSLSEASFRRAEQFLRVALDRDPNFGEAWAALADCLTRLVSPGWIDLQTGASEACEAAMRGVEADPNNGSVLGVAAWTLAMFAGHHDQAAEFSRRALRLHPNSAYVRTCCGWTHIFCGDQSEALANLHLARRMSPIDPRGYIVLTAMGASCFFARQFEETVRWTARALEQKRNAVVALRYRGAAFAHLGRLEEARSAMAELVAFQPDASMSVVRKLTFRYPWMKEMLVEGLRLAGAPE